MHFVVRELERLGYAWAHRVVDTRAFGLPHRRKRVFILASLDGDPRDVLLAQISPCGAHSTAAAETPAPAAATQLSAG